MECMSHFKKLFFKEKSNTERTEFCTILFSLDCLKLFLLLTSSLILHETEFSRLYYFFSPYSLTVLKLMMYNFKTEIFINVRAFYLQNSVR